MVQSFLDHIRVEKRYSKHTINAYALDLRQYVDFIKDQYGNLSWSEHSHLIIRSWLAQIIDTNTARTVNRKISSLKSYYKYLEREAVIENNPMEKIEAPKTKKSLPGFIDESKMNLLLDQSEFEKGFEGIRNKMILQLFYYTGMRLSELINLKINDVDFSNLSIKVLGKRNKERIIPIVSSFVLELKEYIELKQAQFPQGQHLICLNNGKKLYPKFAYRVVNRYLSSVSTQNKTSPHVLRHTFATHMLNNGADLNSIKELLGHANLSATQVYTHNTFEKLKNIYKQAHPRA